MKYFLSIVLLSLFQNILYSQTDTISKEVRKDTIQLDLKNPMISAIALYKAFTEIKGLYKSLVVDYKSLLEIKGNYFNMGYMAQGIKTLEMGISHGKRELISISKFQEIHLNAQYAVSSSIQHKYFYGLNLGISKSGLLFNKALEGQFITDFNGNKAFIFRPELGLTFFGTFNFNYGINLSTNKLEGLNTHVFHFRYTHQDFKEKIKEKILQIKTTLDRDKARLKSLGFDIPKLEVIQ